MSWFSAIVGIGCLQHGGALQQLLPVHAAANSGGKTCQQVLHSPNIIICLCSLQEAARPCCQRTASSLS
jgi:hypothetical protein